MSAKKLDQSVFEGLPVEYRWAAVDMSGNVFAYSTGVSVKTWAWHYESKDCSCMHFFAGSGYDASDWQNSLIERQDVPTAADIDWSKAPEGATHYNTYSHQWFAVFGGGKVKVFNGGMWNIVQGYTVADLEDAAETIKRPESINEVARSIEAARVAEKSGNRCATCTANICSVIDDCYVQRAKEESSRIEEQACMPFPDGDARYFEMSDAVNNPAHYTTGGIECIDAMQAMLSREEFIGYLRGNIFKYQWRYKHKNGVEDLRKADWYAQRLIRVEGEK